MKADSGIRNRSTWSVPPTALLGERFHRLMVKRESLSRLARGWLHEADLDIVGAYNTSNVGDRSFAVCLASAAKSLGLDASLQDYSRYRHSRHSRRLVIGGGGVIGPQNAALRSCAEHRSAFGGAVSVIGVAGALSPEDVAPPLRNLLRGAKFVSTRDRKSQLALEQVLERTVELQPDIAFSLLDWFPSLQHLRSEPSPFTIGFSVSAVLASRGGLHYSPNPRPSPWFAARLPDIAAVYPDVAPAYIRLVRSAVRAYVAAGFRVVVVPFAAEDATFARAILSGSGATFVPFDSDPVRTFAWVARCHRFVATRFHAHVFALLARVPLLSLAYSSKCNLLLTEVLGSDPSVGPVSWVSEPKRCEAYLVDSDSGVMLGDSEWAAARSSATRATVRGLTAIL